MITEEEVLQRRWYAVPNDLIGGWDCATIDKPVSAIRGKRPTRERIPVETWGELTARHVAELHNAALDRLEDEMQADTDAAVARIDGPVAPDAALDAVVAALPDASLTLSGKFNSAAEAERDRLAEAIRGTYTMAKVAPSRAEVMDLLKDLAELVERKP